MYFIGINDTHNSSVAIFRRGKLIFASEEERFVRSKMISGFPKHSLEYAIKKFKIKSSQIEHVAMATKYLTGMNIWNVAADFTVENWNKLQDDYFLPLIYNKKKSV